MECKFTSDGRKVVVVGALNAKETIVQEIFVTGGSEFPAGEHFVVKTLLDAPAETYKAKEERRIMETIKRLEVERDKLSTEISRFRFDASAAAAKIKWIKGVSESEVEEVFDNVRAMICGEYTHVVFPGYDVEIKAWDHKLFSTANDYYGDRFESLRLISLFGEWNGRLSLSWKANTFRDGSGSTTSFIPCKSLEEAIEKARDIIYGKKDLSDKDYAFCLKYSIPIEKDKNDRRLANKAEYIQKQIAERNEQLAKLEADLAAINGQAQ